MITLKVYGFENGDIYAAESAEQAIELCDGVMEDGEEPAEWDDAMLDKPIPEFDENEEPTGRMTSVREFLNESTEPGWLAGTEW